MSVQSSTQTMAAPRADSFFPTPVAETLLRTEDQMHAHMEKARSAFERMSKKAQEAQAAKDKEIAELRKALALAEESVKALQTTSQEKIDVLQKQLQIQEEREKEKDKAFETLKSTMEIAIADLAKGTFGPNPDETRLYKAAKYVWNIGGRGLCESSYSLCRDFNILPIRSWASSYHLAVFFDKAKEAHLI